MSRVSPLPAIVSFNSPAVFPFTTRRAVMGIDLRNPPWLPCPPVKWRVCRSRCEVQEERFRRRDRIVAPDPPDRIIHQVSREMIALFGPGKRLHGVQVAVQVRLPLTGSRADETAEVLEPQSYGPAIEWADRTDLPHRGVVPLTECRGTVPVRSQDFGDAGGSLRPERVITRIASHQFGDPAESDLVTVAARKQSRPRGGAHRSHVEAVVAQTTGS